MSKHLSKIRKLVQEIGEIQKQGQKHSPMPAAPTPKQEIPDLDLLENFVSLPLAPKVESVEATGRVAIKMTGNVVLQLELDQNNETVEVSRNQNELKILFSDGKAVHLPLKAVA